MNKKEPQKASEILDSMIDFFTESEEHKETTVDEELLDMGFQPDMLTDRVNKLINRKIKEVGLSQLKKAHEERLSSTCQEVPEINSLPTERKSIIEAIQQLSCELGQGAQLQMSWRDFENAEDADLRVILQSLLELKSQSTKR